MNEEELEEHLGTIANSGSFEFKNALDKGQTDVDIIGQFGVGFYSAFMVASQVEVFLKNMVMKKDMFGNQIQVMDIQ